MKILFVSGSFNQGGAEYQILALARLFKSRGHEVFVFALTNYDFFKPFLFENQIVFHCEEGSTSKLNRIWNLAKFIRSFKPDSIVAFLRVVGISTIIARALSLHKCKLLIGERTSLELPKQDSYYFNIMRLTDVLTTNSPDKYQYIINRFPFLKKKTYHIGNIIDIKRFHTSNNQEHKEFRFIYAGRIAPEKQVMQLIQAFKLVLNKYKVKLTICGDTKFPDYQQEILDYINSNDTLKNAIFWKGRVDNMENFYQESDVLCLLSAYEGFSNVISEALASGLPCLVSDNSENRYLIEEGVNGLLVDAIQLDEVSSKMIAFIEMENSKFQIMRKNARMKAEELFSENRIYEQYYSLLN